MLNKETRIRSVLVFCLFLTFTPLATSAHAQGPQPAQLPDPAVQADAGFQAAKSQLALHGHADSGRLTTCTSFTRVNTITDPVAAKAAAATSTQPAAQGGLPSPSSQFTTNTSTDATSAQNLSIRIDPSLIIPLPEIPIAEAVTDPVSVTITPDGSVRIEGSGSVAPNERRRAQFYEIDLAKCSVAFRYATATEQSQLDAEYRQKEQQLSRGGDSDRAPGPGELSQPTMQSGDSGWAYRSLRLITRDPIWIPVAETMQQLSWGWSSGSVYYWNGWHYCYPYNPTAAGTHWYLQWCSDVFPWNSYGAAYVSNSANYWNTDFIQCQWEGGTAYTYHYVSLTGFPYGWYNYNWSEYHYGARCSQNLWGAAYFY